MTSYIIFELNPVRAPPVSLKSIAVLGHVSSPFYVRCLVLLFFFEPLYIPKQ